MKIKIPLHNPKSPSSVRSRDMIEAILVLADCRNIGRKPGPNRTVMLFGERVLEKGRIHIKAECIEGNYVIDAHCDSEAHRKRPRGITQLRSKCYEDCLEVRRFLNEFVLPSILRNRTHFYVMISGKWRHRNTLLDEKNVKTVFGYEMP